MEWAEYAVLYPDGPEEKDYERFRWQARRIMDRVTTGVDGVRKLSAAPPTEPDAVQAVERCQAALVHALWQMEREECYVNREDGTVTGRVVTAITAGSESVSFAAPGNGAVTAREKEERCRRMAEMYLEGVADANGVNLTYMGRYPMKAGA